MTRQKPDGFRSRARLLPPCRCLRTACFYGLLMLPAVRAAAAPGDLADLSIEELMNETVTSVSKKAQNLFDTAAAISVLSNEDLRRSGATSVADALRTVPGLDVATINAGEWAISSRGFNNQYANKLLVLIDGRAVYTPLFAGVSWDLQQPMMEDLDRIEVIRGPGATVWGANAVNGVISMVSREARQTQGTLIYGGGGDVSTAMSGARHGGRIGDNTYYRIFGSYRRNDDFPLPGGEPAQDRWQSGHGGFRVDHDSGPDTRLTWQADATSSALEDGASNAYNLNTLGRWTQQLSGGSRVELQAYYDRTHRYETRRSISTLDTTDLSFQHNVAVDPRNDLVWGLGYRHVGSRLGQITPLTRVEDGNSQLQLFSAFAQNEFTLLPHKLMLTAGVKLEHNEFTGAEIQPSIRGVFKPTERQTLWSAVSRAVRTPDMLEARNTFAIAYGAPFTGPDGGLYLPTLVGNRGVRSEQLWAYELGYRIQPDRRVSIDIAAFYNDYSELISFGNVQDLIPGDPVGIAEIPWSNVLEGETHGGEITLAVSPIPSWRLTANYSLLLTRLQGSSAEDRETREQSAPRNKASLRSSLDLGRQVGIDAQLRYVDAIQAAPAYLTADLRLSYRPSKLLEFSLVGQNLLDRSHLEQAPIAYSIQSEVPRGVYGKLVWHFQ